MSGECHFCRQRNTGADESNPRIDSKPRPAAPDTDVEDKIVSSLTDDTPNVPDATLFPSRGVSVCSPNNLGPTPDNRNILSHNSRKDTGNTQEGALQPLEDR